jgi:diguanylate cyclase (GGDEF)-like protein
VIPVHKQPLDSFIDYAPMPIAILDAGLRFVKVNGAMAKAHPITVETYLGKTFAEVFPHVSRETQHMLLNVLRTGEPAIATMNGDVPSSSVRSRGWLATFFPCGESQIAIVALAATDEATGEALRVSNLRLDGALAALQRSVLVNEMVHCLRAAKVAEDLYRIFGRFAPRLFPDNDGSLCVIDSSKKVIEARATWGDSSASEPLFLTEDCRALCEGRTHLVRDPKADRICPHATGEQHAQICVPMMDQSTVLGLLHLQSRSHRSPEPFTDGELEFVQIVAEELALSLANVRLMGVLRERAFRDSLTGLYNRRFLEEAIEIEVRRARRKGWPIALIMIDVDGLKPFNDRHGHTAGDSLLRTVGASLQSSVRSNDILCRYGGDEFSLVMPEASVEDAVAWADRWAASTTVLSIEWGGKELRFPTVSMGAAAYPACLTSDALFREADSALYSAKAAGRNQVKPSIASSLLVPRSRFGT